MRVGPSQTDTAWLDAHLTAEDAMAVRLVLDAAATSMATRTGETRNRDQLRAAALAAPFWAALATGQLPGPDGAIPLAVAHGQAPALELVVDPHDQGAVPDLAGYGPITPGLGHGPGGPGRHRPAPDRAGPPTPDQPARRRHRPELAPGDLLPALRRLDPAHHRPGPHLHPPGLHHPGHPHRP